MKTFIMLVAAAGKTLPKALVKEVKNYIGLMNIEPTEDDIPGVLYNSQLTTEQKENLWKYLVENTRINKDIKSIELPISMFCIEYNDKDNLDSIITLSIKKEEKCD